MRWISLAAALALLDAALTFLNVWPTPAIWWAGAMSVELALCLLAAILVRRRISLRSRTFPALLGALWTVLAIGRYAEVTAPALYGRDINLYWDLRFIPDVIAMVTRVAPAWMIGGGLALIAIAVALVFWLFRMAWQRIAAGIDDPLERRLLAVAAAAVIVVFIPWRAASMFPEDSAFPSPVTLTYARQLRMATRAAAAELGPSPAMDSDLSRVKGADVFLIFMESYGAIAYDRAEIAEGLAPARRDFEKALRATNRQVVSAFVESPTFGGSSWLAHLSLISGIEVRDPEANAKLMTEKRNTLVRTFGRRGFRTVALMPGMRQRWPEGEFYGFDEIYGIDRLAYTGPQFGWFAVPDQYSLHQLDALEGAPAGRKPLFVVFPTISTHFPFTPTPPYQPDWRRLSTAAPYDDRDTDAAYAKAKEMDWVDFAPGYIEAMTYDFASIAGYLERSPDRDVVLILLGDHQPPAVLSGAHAPWDVPIHIVASRREVLARLTANGFRPGLTPGRPTLTKMHQLVPILMDAFGATAPGAMAQ
jgi:hypothetical protein